MSADPEALVSLNDVVQGGHFGEGNVQLRVYIIHNDRRKKVPSKEKILILPPNTTVEAIIKILKDDGYDGCLGAEVNTSSGGRSIKVLESADDAKTTLADFYVQVSGSREAMFFYGDSEPAGQPDPVPASVTSDDTATQHTETKLAGVADTARHVTTLAGVADSDAARHVTKLAGVAGSDAARHMETKPAGVAGSDAARYVTKLAGVTDSDATRHVETKPARSDSDAARHVETKLAKPDSDAVAQHTKTTSVPRSADATTRHTKTKKTFAPRSAHISMTNVVTKGDMTTAAFGGNITMENVVTEGDMTTTAFGGNITTGNVVSGGSVRSVTIGTGVSKETIDAVYKYLLK